MTEFGKLQSLQLSFTKMNSYVQYMDNQRTLENLSSTGQGFLSFFNGNFSIHQQQPQLHMNFTDDVHTFMGLSSPPVSKTDLNTNIQGFGGRKRKRKEERDLEKPKEVIHVRAKRGQATDSHSLAERVRREKINARLKCLKDLVPGCYKTMGMAVMLDVIINYVRSLQNQIEFLSMKLSAASMYYNFNLERDAMATVQGTNGYELEEMERMVRGGGCGGSSNFHSTWLL